MALPLPHRMASFAGKCARLISALLRRYHTVRNGIEQFLQGLYMNIVERPEDITSMSIPTVVRQTCDAWDRYSSQVLVNQIDSGLKE